MNRRNEPGARLDAWMKLETWSDTRLAAALEMDRSYIYRLRTCQRPISDSFRWQFGRRFGLDLAQRLLNETRETA